MDMRRWILAAGACGLIGVGVSALWADPSCTARGKAPLCKKPCPPRPICVKVPQYIETPESEPESMPEGAFASPPRTGVVVGESEAVGIEGGELRIPSLSLRLPTLRLPSVRRYRRNAHMEMESADAPYVENIREEFSFDAGQEAEPEAAPLPPRRTPESDPACTTRASNEAALQRELAQMQARYAEAQQRLNQLQAEVQGRRLPPCPDGRLCPPPVPTNIPVPVPDVQQPQSVVPRGGYEAAAYEPVGGESTFVGGESLPRSAVGGESLPRSAVGGESLPRSGAAHDPSSHVAVERRMERLEAMMTMMYGEMQQQRLAAAAAREQSEAAAAPLRFATYEQEIRRLPPAEAPDPYMEYSGE